MPGLTRETRLQIMLDEKELQAIDDWRFRQRMPSRASAIRRLIRAGLEREGYDVADSQARSGDYGVISNKGERSGEGNEGQA